jgi:hypothetical protein
MKSVRISHPRTQSTYLPGRTVFPCRRHLYSSCSNDGVWHCLWNQVLRHYEWISTARTVSRSVFLREDPQKHVFKIDTLFLPLDTLLVFIKSVARVFCMFSHLFCSQQPYQVRSDHTHLDSATVFDQTSAKFPIEGPTYQSAYMVPKSTSNSFCATRAKSEKKAPHQSIVRKMKSIPTTRPRRLSSSNGMGR